MEDTLPRGPMQMSEPRDSCFHRSRLWSSVWNAHSEAHTLLRADLTPLCPVLGLRPGSGKLSSPRTNVCRSNPKIQSSSVLFKTLAAKSCLHSHRPNHGWVSFCERPSGPAFYSGEDPSLFLPVRLSAAGEQSFLQKRIPPATSPICSLEEQEQLTLKISRPRSLQGCSSGTCEGCHF